MMRTWVAVALLSCSWLAGLGYYAPSSMVTGAVMVIVAAALLAGLPLAMPAKREAWMAVACCAAAFYLLPWPSRMAPLAIGVGLLLPLTAPDWRWTLTAGRGLIAAGCVLASQSVLMWLYEAGTARSHELPEIAATAVAAVIRLLGAEVAIDGNELAIAASGKVHHVGLTWDLWLDPATLGFFVGGTVVLAICPSAVTSGRGWAEWVRAVRWLLLVVAGWLPVRAALVLGLLVQQIDRAQVGLALNVMDIFFSPWLHLALLAGPVLLAWRFGIGSSQGVATRQSIDATGHRGVAAGLLASMPSWRIGKKTSVGLAAAGAAAFGVLLQWEPIGSRKAGRVIVVERHSTWEPTTRAYDTTSYGEAASYTYAAIYDYCARFFTMSRLLESDRIDAETLSRCDVLVIKTPTAAYLPGEASAIAGFVERGGGLLLIGEHTDVFRSSTYLNEVAEPFGFEFRKDLLFRIGSPYVQPYQPPAAPHPAVQNLPPMQFAVSCSIAPGTSRGRAAVRNLGLWSLPPAYDTENYFPQAEHRSDMRYGAFIQLWSTRYGSGRVLAWTDSTIFSNFSAFEPGKVELMLGMLDWLNRRSVWDHGWLRLPAKAALGLLGLAAVVAGLVFSAARGPGWLAMASVVLAGWGIGSSATAAAQRWAMPPPDPVRPMVRVVIDRTVSEVPLSRGGFTHRDGRGFGLIEQWIPRLGYFTARRTGAAAFSGDCLLIVCPTRSVGSEFRQSLIDYVAAGGKLMVIDSPDSVCSTANSLLWPFGLVMDPTAALAGKLHGEENWPDVAVETACAVGGGKPLVWIGETAVAARAEYGRGTVIAVGFGSVFNDTGMGFNWMTEPDEPLRKRFELWYRMMRALQDGGAIDEEAG